MTTEEPPGESQGGVEIEIIGGDRVYPEARYNEKEPEYEEIEDMYDDEGKIITDETDPSGRKEKNDDERFTPKTPPYEDERFISGDPPPEKKDEYARFVSRPEWKAHPLHCPESIPMGKLPVTNLVITWSDTESCSTEKECQERVRQIQYSHIHFGHLKDIQYHFLIGEDNCLYEGRGWRRKGEDYGPEVGPVAAKLNEQHIEVAFIGTQKQPTRDQLAVLSTVVTYGQEEDWITTCFGVYWKCGNSIQFYKTYDATDELYPMIRGNRSLEAK